MSDSELIRSYPYPVLRPDSDDFVDTVFKVDWDEPKELPNAKYEFVFTVTNTCKEIRDLITEGKAVYMLRFVCKTTLCRRTFTFSEDICRIQLSLPDFLNYVIITPMIVALNDIENYSCEAFHPDYQGLEISVRMGDVLAISHPLYFDAPAAPEIQENPESIIHFRKSNRPNPPTIQIDDGSHCIYIELSPDMHEILQKIGSDTSEWAGKEPIIMSMFAIPALAEVLGRSFTEDKIEDAEANGLTWFKVIRDRFVKLGLISLDEYGKIITDEGYFTEIGEHPITYAEYLLENPTECASKALYDMIMRTDDFEEEE